MFNRHQVLVTDWQTGYLRHIAKQYRVSFSEVIRVALSLFFMDIISSFHPRYNPPFTTKKITKILNDVANRKMHPKEIQQLISNLYFEARKAVEYRLENLEPKPTKSARRNNGKSRRKKKSFSK